MCKKFASFARIIISLLMLFIMGVLSLASLLSTTGMESIENGQGVDSVVNRIYEARESVIYYHDDVFVNLVMLAVFAVLCFLILPRMQKLPCKAELLFITVWTIAWGAVWVNSSMVQPTYDSAYVTEDAMAFAKNDFSAMSGKYLQEYPYQLGYILLNEIIIRIASAFGKIDNLVFIQVINAVFLALIYDAVILINDLVFADKRIRHMTVLLLTFCVQPVIFCSFLYGILPAFAFSVWAVCLEILYFKTDKLWAGILSAVCLGLAVMLKSNNYIVMIAVLIIAAVQLLQRKHYLKDAVYLILAGIMAMTSLPAVQTFYEKRSGIELGDSIPYISWIAMGMTEGYRAPGWYRGTYTTDKFEELGMDQAATKEFAEQIVKERLIYFKENPQYRKDFFYRKFVSQWNETSYQSIWNNTVRKQYQDKGRLAEWVCHDGKTRVKAYMDFYAQLVFAACAAALIGCLKNKNFFSIAMPLVILGGVLYHLLSEAKSQYALPYFILMAGVAAYGICLCYDLLAPKIRNYPKLAKLFPVQEISQQN